MLINWEGRKFAEMEFRIRYDMTTYKENHELSQERLTDMVMDMKAMFAGRRPPKKFVRVQRNDEQAGLALKRRQVEALPILPDPVRRPPATLMGMNWAKTGEHWPDVEYEKDKSPLGLLMYSAAKHNLFRLKHASIEHRTGFMRLKVDTIQEAISEAFILYGQLGLDIETQSTGEILTPIQWRFMDYVREGFKRRAVMA